VRGDGGGITVRSSTGSCGSCVRVRRGVTCQNASDHGRPAMSACGDGQPMAPEIGSSRLHKCMTTAHRCSGRSASTRRSCGPTSIPLAPAKRGLLVKCGDAWCARWRGHRPVPRRTEHENPPRCRRTRPTVVDPAHARSGRRQPATFGVAGCDPGQRARTRPAPQAPRGAYRRQLRTNIGNVAPLDDAVAAFNPTERIKGKTIIRVRP
jgi:hypothetical protein